MRVLAFVLAVVLSFVVGVASTQYCPYVQRVLSCNHNHTKCGCDCCGYCCGKCECKDCTCCPACPGKSKCNSKAKPCCNVKE